MVETSMIAVDWGTTSLRAWRLDPSGGIIDRRRERLGIQQVVNAAFADTLGNVIGDWRREAPLAPVLMAGMIGSRQGWIEAPYATCPAGLEMVARHLAVVPDDPRIWIVPGLSLRAGAAAPDVMRGEETQLFGLDLPSGGLVILPGTHSKWTLLREGLIEWFATFLTGELYDVLRRHSILGRLMEEATTTGDVPDGFASGLTDMLSPSGPGTLQALFSVRTRGLFGDLKAAQLPGYLSGLLIGSEIKEALGAVKARAGVPRGAVLVGAESLTAIYAFALARAGIATTIAGEDCSARGLFRIAAAAAIIAPRVD